MIDIRNNFNFTTRLRTGCDVKIDILNKIENQVPSEKDVYCCAYLMDVTLTDKNSDNFLFIENMNIIRVEDRNVSESELDIKKAGKSLSFTLEENVLRTIVSDADVYQRFLRKDKVALNIVKNWSDNESFLQLSRMKSCYEFIVQTFSL